MAEKAIVHKISKEEGAICFTGLTFVFYFWYPRVSNRNK